MVDVIKRKANTEVQSPTQIKKKNEPKQKSPWKCLLSTTLRNFKGAVFTDCCPMTWEFLCSVSLTCHAWRVKTHVLWFPGSSRLHSFFKGFKMTHAYIFLWLLMWVGAHWVQLIQHFSESWTCLVVCQMNETGDRHFSCHLHPSYLEVLTKLRACSNPITNIPEVRDRTSTCQEKISTKIILKNLSQP